MLLSPYSPNTENELVGDIDTLARKLRRKRLKLQYPDRRSPYAIDINDSVIVPRPSRSVFQSRGTVIAPSFPIGYESAAVETIPSTPVHRKSEIPDISSLAETGLSSPMARPAIGRMDYLLTEEERIKGEIAVLEGDLQGAPSEDDQRQWQAELVDYREKLDALQTDIRVLKQSLSTEDKHLVKQLKAEHRAQQAEEEAKKLNEKLRVQSEQTNAAKALKAEYDRVFADHTKYIYFNLDTGKTVVLGTNKKDAASAMLSKFGVRMTKNDIKPREYNPSKLRDNTPLSFEYIILRPANVARDTLKPLIIESMKRRRKK